MPPAYQHNRITASNSNNGPHEGVPVPLNPSHPKGRVRNQQTSSSPLKQLPRTTSHNSSIRDFEEYNGVSRRTSRKGFIEDEVTVDEENPMYEGSQRKSFNPPSSSAKINNGHPSSRRGSQGLHNDSYRSEYGHGNYGMMNGYGGYGMGGYGGMGYGMYGMGYGGMGYGGMGMLMGPMAWINSINYLFMTVHQLVGMLGMNSHLFVNMVKGLSLSLQRFEATIRQSSFRFWLQQKSKKSKLLRFIFVLASMALAAQGARFFRDALMHITKSYLGQSSASVNMLTFPSNPSINASPASQNITKQAPTSTQPI
jgi:hypothetical protein